MNLMATCWPVDLSRANSTKPNVPLLRSRICQTQKLLRTLLNYSDWSYKNTDYSAVLLALIQILMTFPVNVVVVHVIIACQLLPRDRFRCALSTGTLVQTQVLEPIGQAYARCACTPSDTCWPQQQSPSLKICYSSRSPQAPAGPRSLPPPRREMGPTGSFGGATRSPRSLLGVMTNHWV